MDQGLSNLLQRIWREQAPIIRNPKPGNYIYENYYALTASSRVVEQVGKDFVDKLKIITENSEGKVVMKSQKSHHGRGVHFYHFNPSDWNHADSIRLVRWRVYLSPKGEDQVLGVFEYIVNKFVAPNVTHGLARPVKAKVSTKLGRPDTIVVYATDRLTAEYIANCIPAGFRFNDNIPVMTKKIDLGISIASEPPAATNRDPQSFGETRCNIIAEALLEASSITPTSWMTFIELTVKKLRKVGIDPNHPEEQTNMEDLKAVHQLQCA